MRRRRPIIPQRRVIFIGCEGASEVGYAQLLQDLANSAGLHIHLDIRELGPGAGDPLHRIELAVTRLRFLRRARTDPAERFVLVDNDQAARAPQRAERAITLARENNIHIMWQRPCFEAFLLRHLPGRAAHRPPTSQAALNSLRQAWAEYRKPMSRLELSKRIDLEAIRRAAAVEPEFDAMLRQIGLIDP
jgi:hypothetical protein